jgi:phage shock protein PspC (stress-responsive transcriptional regulator)
MKDDNSQKKLYRTKNDRMISGVCGGVAEYFGIDSTIVRIIWVVMVFFGGVGAVMYLAAMILVPENPDEVVDPSKPQKKADKNLFWGALLIIVGLLLILRQFGFMHHFDFFHFNWISIWALILIGLGIFMLFNMNSSKSDQESGAPINSDTPSIYRSRTDRKVAGVCAGLAIYFNMDANLIRLAFVLLTLASMGFGVIAYIVMIIIFPEEPAIVRKEEK